MNSTEIFMNIIAKHRHLFWLFVSHPRNKNIDLTVQWTSEWNDKGSLDNHMIMDGGYWPRLDAVDDNYQQQGYDDYAAEYTDSEENAYDHVLIVHLLNLFHYGIFFIIFLYVSCPIELLIAVWLITATEQYSICLRFYL